MAQVPFRRFEKPSLRIICFTALTVCLILFPFEILKAGGRIRGTAKLCIPGSVNGTLVYIPGKSFFVKTDSSGQFRLFNVPQGNHSLIFEVPGMGPQKITNINVVNKQVTNLGNVDVCPDGDGDGFDISKDCDDTDEDVFPGAEEVCNEKDDDCDGNRDDGLVPNPQDVSINILSPEDGSSTSLLNSMTIYIGGACTPEENSVIAVVKVPDGFPIKAALYITKPSGDKEFVIGADPNNPGEFHICIPICQEPSCCTLASMSTGGGFPHIFTEEGEYTLEAIVFDINNAILALDSISLVNP